MTRTSARRSTASTKLGIADNTFVMYSTDNGPHMNSWPDGGMTPFRNEKNTNWEGAFRVPLVVRWPGKIKPGQISNEIVQHHDWFPTFLAMAGDPDVIGEAEEWLSGDRPHLQEPPRRLQSASLSDRSGEEEPAKLLHVSQRRRRRSGPALRQLEDRVHGAALPRHACGSGRSRSPSSGCRSCSTFAPILTSGRISRRTAITTGSCDASS